MELGLLDVLQHHALAAFLSHHALIVRQVVSRRLNAMIAIAGRQNLVHHADGRLAAELRIAIFRIDGQIVFDLLQMAAKELELLCFNIVAEIHVGFEARFVAEYLVVVGFIRPDGDVDGRIQVHPRKIAFVIVVRKERGAARQQKLLQCCVAGESSRLLHQSGGFGQIVFVLLAVGNCFQPPGGIAAYHGEEALGSLAVRLGKRFHPTLEFLAGHVFRIEVRAGQFLGWDVREKRCVIVDVRPGSLVDPEIMQPSLTERGRIALQLLVQLKIPAPHLLQKNVVQNPRRLDQLRERFAIAGREIRNIGAEFGGREAGDHLVEVREIGSIRCGEGKHRNTGQQFLHFCCHPSTMFSR